VLKLVQTQQPKDATHWSTREIAKQVGISHTKVHQILQAHDLKPHLVKRFRSSDDPAFEQKLEDIVGLYLNPPENAIVLSIDEKSQVQALERAQPILPLRQGIPERQTHDYVRHGTTTLFAALDIANGQVLTQNKSRHRHQEFIWFLKQIDREVPAGLELHLIADNYGTHKHERVRAWLAKHPRFHMHFTPTGSSWLNLVERFFRDLSQVDAEVQRVVQHERARAVQPAHEATADRGHVDERERVQQPFTAADAGTTQVAVADRDPVVVGARHALGHALGARRPADRRHIVSRDLQRGDVGGHGSDRRVVLER
jgi:transposase